jgi:hypothetical protein
VIVDESGLPFPRRGAEFLEVTAGGRGKFGEIKQSITVSYVCPKVT